LGHRLSETTKEKLSIHNRGKAPCQQARENALKSVQKTYQLIDPSGNLVEITNMADFCRKNGYNKGQMCLLVTGKKLSYRGWNLPTHT
jgi:hypothetical protein